MSAPARLLFPALVAAAAACGSDDSSAPPGPPDRELLNGLYACAQADVFYAGTGGVDASERWRVGTCADYIFITNPSREYDIDTTGFTITDDDRIVRRREFPTGVVTYDQSTGRLRAEFVSGDTASYTASIGVLHQVLPAADYTGDGRLDSLELTFVRVQ